MYLQSNRWPAKSNKYEALRRVHLIPSGDLIPDQLDTIENINVFRNLDSPVSEGGDNFSTGWVTPDLTYCDQLIVVKRKAAPLYGAGYPQTI